MWFLRSFVCIILCMQGIAEFANLSVLYLVILNFFYVSYFIHLRGNKNWVAYFLHIYFHCKGHCLLELRVSGPVS